MVDDRRLQHVVQLLGLQDAGVHGEVKQQEEQEDDNKTYQEVGEDDAGGNHLGCG